ncbi:MAG: YegS/Rv2252/BmrU family lipid kinase [Methanoregulaceae archaeon]|nr:YegS/Rv2252/BmrU family lipid kinase [Methanoregulaceae archaeon]
MDACLIVNRNSRRARKWSSQVGALLAERGIEIKMSRFVSGGRHLDDAGKQAAESGIGVVVIGGGDGTISGLAKYFAKTGLTVGLLPFGTGNALVRDLDIPVDLAQACDVIARQERRQIDLGQVNDAYFVNHVAVGASTLVSRSLNPQAKRVLGKLAYLAAAFRAYIHVTSFRAELTMDGERSEFDTLQIVAGNGRHHAGPFLLSPEASLESGKVVVYALESTDRRRLIELVRRLPSGDHVNMPDVKAYSGVAGSLRTNRSVRVSVDGEVGLRTPIEFSIVPQALTVFAPEATAV